MLNDLSSLKSYVSCSYFWLLTRWQVWRNFYNISICKSISLNSLFNWDCAICVTLSLQINLHEIICLNLQLSSKSSRNQSNRMLEVIIVEEMILKRIELAAAVFWLDESKNNMLIVSLLILFNASKFTW